MSENYFSEDCVIVSVKDYLDKLLFMFYPIEII